MYKNIVIHFVLIVMFQLVLSCQSKNEEVILEHFKVSVPDDFVVQDADLQNDELLKLSNNNQVNIVVQNNLGNIIKMQEGMDLGIDVMKYVHSLKFNILQTSYHGHSPGRLVRSTVNGHEFVSQEFKGEVGEEKAYYEYRIMKIGDEYYEFIISGIESSKKKYSKQIDEFYNSIIAL